MRHWKEVLKGGWGCGVRVLVLLHRTQTQQVVVISFKMCSVIVLLTRKQTVQSLLPGSVLTRGGILLGGLEVTLFVGSCWRSHITHVNYLLRGQRLGFTPASLFKPNTENYINWMDSSWVTFCRSGVQYVLGKHPVRVWEKINWAFFFLLFFLFSFPPFPKKRGKKATIMGSV